MWRNKMQFIPLYFLGLFLLPHCGETLGVCNADAEGCSCDEQGACRNGLECVENMCIRPENASDGDDDSDADESRDETRTQESDEGGDTVDADHTDGDDASKKAEARNDDDEENSDDDEDTVDNDDGDDDQVEDDDTEEADDQENADGDDDTVDDDDDNQPGDDGTENDNSLNEDDDPSVPSDVEQEHDVSTENRNENSDSNTDGDDDTNPDSDLETDGDNDDTGETNSESDSESDDEVETDPNASPGDETNVPGAYLKMGDLRLINNRWGSDELGCGGADSQKVFINDDKTFGWQFDRGTCGGNMEKPDYPEVEFGIHPFGIGSSLETSPPFSSTDLLPLQIKDISSASVQLDNLNIEIWNAASWNLNFEMWFSQEHPVESANPGAYAELMVFWGWQTGRWPCDQTGSMTAGDNSYDLCHQSDNWGHGWRYYQFRVQGGPWNSYSGRIDVKAILDWLVNNAGFSQELWVTRFEIGSEIDDNTSGRATMNSLTVTVNGESRSPEFSE